MDHVPPKQFYPKEVRQKQSPQLWLVPTHRRCNAAHRQDEEYFYHAVYALVHDGNRAMGETIFRDLIRRTTKPQTPAMLRNILKEARVVTRKGIHLPGGVVQLNFDQYRLQRIAIKIAQGLFYSETNQFLAASACKDIRICRAVAEVPELYSLSWQGTDAKSVLTSVFSFRRFEVDGFQVFSLLFWEAFMFCMTFETATTANDLEHSQD